MDILKTLKYMKHNIKVTVWDNDINKIFYNEDEDFRPTVEDILNVNQEEVEADYKLKHYSELRKAAYPPMADYLDGIVKGDNAQVQEYINKCLAIKAKYPKP